MIGPPDSLEYLKNMLTMQETCALAGLPVEPAKSVGLATSLVFLGIEMDSTRGILQLPEDKFLKVKETLTKSRHVESRTSSHSSGSYLTPAKWSGPAEYFFAG